MPRPWEGIRAFPIKKVRETKSDFDPALFVALPIPWIGTRSCPRGQPISPGLKPAVL
jgi:hypothetical protein